MKSFFKMWAPLLTVFIFVGCSSTRSVYLPKDVQMLTRQQWGSANPVLKMRKHVPGKITLHHTAVKQNEARSLTDKLKSLQKFSMERSPLSDGRIKEPWADIPYHFYIAANGEIGEGRQLKYVGDSNTPYDPTGHALIVLEGNFNVEPVTQAQKESLQKLVVAMAKQYRIGADKISGHKDHASTGCPGTDLYNLIDTVKTWVASNE